MGNVVWVTNRDGNESLRLNTEHVVSAYPQDYQTRKDTWEPGMLLSLSSGEEIVIDMHDWGKVKSKIWKDE